MYFAWCRMHKKISTDIVTWSTRNTDKPNNFLCHLAIMQLIHSVLFPFCGFSETTAIVLHYLCFYLFRFGVRARFFRLCVIFRYVDHNVRKYILTPGRACAIFQNVTEPLRVNKIHSRSQTTCLLYTQILRWSMYVLKSCYLLWSIWIHLNSEFWLLTSSFVRVIEFARLKMRNTSCRREMKDTN